MSERFLRWLNGRRNVIGGLIISQLKITGQRELGLDWILWQIETPPVPTGNHASV